MCCKSPFDKASSLGRSEKRSGSAFPAVTFRRLKVYGDHAHRRKALRFSDLRSDDSFAKSNSGAAKPGFEIFRPINIAHYAGIVDFNKIQRTRMLFQNYLSTLVARQYRKLITPAS